MADLLADLKEGLLPPVNLGLREAGFSATLASPFPRPCLRRYGVYINGRDFDFDRRLVQVRRTLDTIRGVPIEKPYAKTDSSLRGIELSPATIELVQRHLEQFPRPLLFQDGDRPWNRHDFLNAYRGLLRRAQIPYRRFHAIRHICATSLLKAGCYLPAVRKRLGQAKVSTTLDIYAAYLPSDQAPLAMSFERTVRQWLPNALQGSGNDSPMIPPVSKGAGPSTPPQPGKVRKPLKIKGFDGARDWTRTSTRLLPLAPQASASTNSATRARGTPTAQRPRARARHSLPRRGPPSYQPALAGAASSASSIFASSRSKPRSPAWRWTSSWFRSKR